METNQPVYTKEYAMNEKMNKTVYQPGFYGKKRQRPDEWVEAYIKKWNKEESDKKQAPAKSRVFPSICFSRQIGVGALEIADLLSEIIQYRVVDREIMEHMAKDANLSLKIIELFDERYPGRMSEFFAMLTSEKTFIKTDYARQLAKTVTALATTEPTIFVGRGTHFILPRDLILSVRIICSKAYRIERLANILNTEKSDAEKHLDRCDREQEKFFTTVYQKKEDSPEEFDLVLNRDHIKKASHAAQIVACAFEQKFGIKR